MSLIHWEKITDTRYEGYVKGICKYWLQADEHGRVRVAQVENTHNYFLKCLTLDVAWKATEEYEEKLQVEAARWSEA